MRVTDAYGIQREVYPINTDSTNAIAPIVADEQGVREGTAGRAFYYNESFFSALQSHIVNEQLTLEQAFNIEAATIYISQQWAALHPYEQQRVRRLMGERGYSLDPLQPTIATVAPPVAAAASVQLQPLPRVTVRIHKEGAGTYRGAWQFDLKVDGQPKQVPRSTLTVKQFLPKEYKQSLRVIRNSSYNTETELQRVLEEGTIPTRILADALKAYLVSKLEQAQDVQVDSRADAEDIALLKAQPATLLVGGVAWQLVPAGGRDMRAQLKGIRARVKKGAADEVARLKEQGAAEAKLVVRSAELQAEAQRKDLAKLKAAVEREAASRPPQWLLDSKRMFRLRGAGEWEVEINVLAKVLRVELTAPSWGNVLLSWAALPLTSYEKLECRLRVQQDGNYDLSYVYASDPRGCAPHISVDSLCMTLQGLPATISSAEDITIVQAAISRGMEVVNLASLLNYTPNEWLPSLKKQMPRGVLQLLAQGNRNREWPGYTERQTREEWLAAEGHVASWDSELLPEDARAEIFTV